MLKMLSNIMASLLLVATCVQYGAMDTVYTQKSWPEALGSCVSADCHESKLKNIDTECNRKYTVNGETISDTIYLRKIDGEYHLTKKNGKTTGKTMQIDIKNGITKFARRNQYGDLEEVCCATKTRVIDDDTKQNLEEFCNEIGMIENDNENCKDANDKANCKDAKE